MARRKKTDRRIFWTADCETDRFQNRRVPKPFTWGLWTGAAFHEFDTPDEFADFIQDCDVIIYFHNGGRFDIHFLLHRINLFEDMKVINGRLVVAKIGKAEIRDSWNLLPIALADYKKDSELELIEDFKSEGIEPKQAALLATDYLFMDEPHRLDPRIRRVIRKYHRNDCIYLYELIEQFEKDYGRHLTQAGAAMATWRNMSGLKAPETDRDYFQKFQPYYFGGRVECFQKGEIPGPIEVVDIKSAYPDAMMSEHPYYPDYVETKLPSEFRNTSMLTVDCVSNGALPFRGERGQITFPCDGELRRYYVSGHELRAAMDTTAVSRVDLIHSYDFMNEVSFREYIEYFYSLRAVAKDDGNKAIDIFCKLFMNSLYGKFGANPDNYGNFICVPFQEFEDYLQDGYQFDGMIGPHALLRAALDDWQCRFLNVATAASITSQVRAKLWRAICASEGVAYCDTDSIAARKANVELGKKLGQWELEGTGSRMWIAGKKMYYVEGMDKLNPRTGKMEPKMASKGIRAQPSFIKRMCEGEAVLYEPKAPTFSLHKKPVFTDRMVRMT